MFSGRGRRYEFKVEHGGEQKKWTKFFVHEEDMKSFTPDLLIRHLQEKCRFSNNILNIKYMDSDKDWIDLRCSDFESFVDMVESAEVVPDREDILRVTLKVSASPLSQSNEMGSKRVYSPSPGKQNVSKKRTRIKDNLNNESDDAFIPPDIADNNDRSPREAEQYISPTQKYFSKLETEEQQLQTVVREKERELFELEQSKEPKDKAKVPLCSNCHTGGHNKTNCVFAPCVSASLCHDIKRHPDESKFLKVKREELKSTKAKLVKIQEDLKSKKQMLKGVQDTFVAKVQTDLINSDPEKYLRKSTTGQLVPNWLVVNSDVRKLERVCQGKLPSKSDIPNFIKCYNERFDILRQSPASNFQDDNEHVNPVKNLWEKKGINFPGRGPVPNSTAVVTQKPVDEESGATTGSTLLDLFAEPNSKREEEYLLQIGLNQSLQSVQHDDARPSEINVDTSTTTEEDVGGLGLLFEAARLLEK